MTTIPQRLTTDEGAVYRLHHHPDDPVEMNVRVPSRLREGVRRHAAQTGTTMEQLVARAVGLYLACHEEAA